MIRSVMQRFVVVVLMLASVAACSPSKNGVALGHGAEQWSAAVDRAIPDADRALRLKRLGNQLAVLREAFVRDAEALDERAVALNSDYDATREQAEEVAAAFTSRRQALLTEYRDVVLAMRREVSRAEWKALTR